MYKKSRDRSCKVLRRPGTYVGWGGGGDGWGAVAAVLEEPSSLGYVSMQKVCRKQGSTNKDQMGKKF